MEATGKGLVEHWGWAAEKGLVNKNTAGSLRTACAKVLGVLDNWEAVDVSTLDVEDVLKRFQNLRGTNFKPQILQVYKRRFRFAVRSYLDYVKDPGNWKPGLQERPTRAGRNGDEEHADQLERPGHLVPPTRPPAEGWVTYPFPVREGQIAQLILPRDLKGAEAKRLSAFIATLAVDFEPASGSS